jgi:hypothetical protein
MTMKTHTIIRSWPAIGLGGFFATVTGFVLFEDVLHGAPITTGHLQTMAALVGAIAAGHMSWPAIRKRETFLQGIMLTVLALACTAYITVTSGARNAETAGNKVAAIQAGNVAREREMALLKQAEAMHTEASRKLGVECATGLGKNCRGIKATVDVYDAAIKGHLATIATLPALKVASGYAHAARVLNSWGLAVTDEWLSLNMPFVVVLIAELGTVAFLHLGLGHAKRPEPIWKDEDVAPLPEATDNVLSYCRAFKKANGRPPTIPEVQCKFPELPKTTAWRKAKAA